MYDFYVTYWSFILFFLFSGKGEALFASKTTGSIVRPLWPFGWSRLTVCESHSVRMWNNCKRERSTNTLALTNTSNERSIHCPVEMCFEIALISIKLDCSSQWRGFCGHNKLLCFTLHRPQFPFGQSSTLWKPRKQFKQIPLSEIYSIWPAKVINLNKSQLYIKWVRSAQ